MTRGAWRRFRFLSLTAITVLCVEAAYVAPAAGAAPSAPPVAEPTSSEPPAPTPPPASPSPAPTASPPAPAQAPATIAPAPTTAPMIAQADPVTGLKPGATEMLGARTEYSQTYDNHDGTRTTQFFAEPAFYTPVGSTTLVPIEVGFAPSTAAGVDFISDKAPVSVSIADSGVGANFLSTTYQGRTIGFRLSQAVAKSAQRVSPSASGAVADYANLLPGVDLRVIANAHGAKSFFVWHAVPADPTLRYVVDAPGLTLVPQADGSISFTDAKGNPVAAIPRPYAVDSTPDAFAGGGRYTDRVSLALDPDGRTVTVAVDPDWLKTAVYPVYVDPSTGWVYNAGSPSYGDAHVASLYPNSNYADYHRPDSPSYFEMWNGTDPGGLAGETYDFLRWDLSAYANVTVDSASLRLYPYHQYYNAPTTETTYVRRVTGTWTESGVKWSNKPTYTTTNTASAGCVEASLCTWNVTAIVQLWLQGIGALTNYGFQVDTINKGSTYWKRFIASEQGGSNRPAFSMTYHTPSATASAKPAFTWDRTFAWTYADSGSLPQTMYQVQLSADGGATWPAGFDSGPVSGSATTWTAPGTMTLTDLAAYTWHVRVYNGTSWSAFTANSSFTYDAKALGDEPYYTRVPFNMGGGWGLDVGVHNGEARLSRSLFTIPSFGPEQALELTYSSLNLAAAGPFGYGWSGNLTQKLTLYPSQSLAIWIRADGGRVAFTGSGSSWTTVPGHAETLTFNSGLNEYTVKSRDQSKVVFDGAQGGRLKRIENRFGKALTLTYPSSTQIVAQDATVSPVRQTTLTLAGGLVSTVANSAGQSWSFVHIGSDLSSITEPDPDDLSAQGGNNGPLPAPATTLGYDQSHELTTVARVRYAADGSHPTITWTIGYQGGKAITVADPIGGPSVWNSFTYNAGNTLVGLLKTYSPLVRNTWTYTLDSFGRVTSTLDPGTFTTSRTWDANSNLTSLTVPIDASTTATTTYTYDGAGNLTRETAPLTASTSVITKMTYDPATNDLLSRWEATGLADTDTTPDQTVTRYEYASGHLTAVVVNCTSSGTTMPVFSAGCTGGGTSTDAVTNLRTTYTYTANDQVETETDPLGRVTKHVYDPANLNNETSVIRNLVSGQSATAERNVTTAYVRNGLGLVTTETDQVGVATTRTYDALGRQTREDLAGDAGVSIPDTRRCTAYDDLGNVLTETEAWSPADCASGGTVRTTTHAYDLANRETSRTDPALVTTTTLYDAAGNATSETGGGRTTTRAFDGLGRPTSETANGVTTAFAYDGQGRQLSATVDGTVRQSVYDRAGRLLEEHEDATGLDLLTTHAYDALGRETTTTDPDLIVRTSVYDRVGRLITTIENDVPGTPGPGEDVTTTYAFDRAGNRTGETAPDGTLTTTAYDALDRPITTIANDVAGTPGPGEDLTSRTAYDAAGHTVATVDPASVVTRMIPNPRGLTRTTIENCVDTVPTGDPATCAGTATPSATVNLTSTTMYEGSGTAISTTRVIPGPDATTVQTLDGGGRLIRTVLDPTGLAITTEYGYDTVGRQVAVRDPQGAVSVSIYDPSSGRVVRSISNCTEDTINPAPPSGATWWQCDGSTLADGTWNLTTEYGYDAAGRRTAIRDPRGTITITRYDDADRVIATIVNCTNADNSIPTTGWETCPGTGSQNGTLNVTTTYGYDDRGNRTSETGPNGRLTTSIYDDANRVIQRIENDVTTPTQPDQDLSTFFYYDAAGRQVAVKAPTLDRNTFAVTRSVYDDLGRLTAEIRNCTNSGTTPPADPATCTGAGTANAETNVTTTSSYDAAGNRVTVTSPDPSAAGGSAATVTTRSAFDALGRLCRVVENSTQTDAQWAALADRCTTPISGTATTNTSTSYGYDAAGNLTAMVDAAGHTTTYGYDLAGRLVSTLDADGRTLGYGYDDAGHRIRQENRTDPPLTASVTWTYDLAGRMATRTANNVTTTYTYDANGNQLTASDGTLVLTATFDRLNRVLTVDDEDAGTTPDTTTTYSLTNPQWTDPTGTYGVTLDKFDRATVLDDPANGSNFTWAHRADGQPLAFVQPNGNTTAFAYDNLGRLVSKDTTSGGTNRALYDWTVNRAGQILTEATTITSDPTNNTRGFGYDPLGRLAAFSDGSTVTTWGWDAVPNRTSTQAGANPAVTTTYDPANRPLADSLGGLYASDADGRLTARPDAAGAAYQRLEWDSLGRLTKVKNGAGTVTLATYTYDPLDRLRMVDYGSGNRVRFRYVGLTTSAVQTVNDATGTVIRSIGTGWGGEPLLDWTGSGQNIRVYGTNSHHDVTWTASNTGTVSGTVRYDPAGVATSVTGSVPEFRFQGSWSDDVTKLSWVVTRWYAPAQARFISEDSLLGESRDPDSRHLYAYGAGDPVGAWDPDGRWWHKVRAGESLSSIAADWLGGTANWRWIWNRNRARIMHPDHIEVGWCLWIPDTEHTLELHKVDDRCLARRATTGIFGWEAQRAATKLGVDLKNLTWPRLVALTSRETGRDPNPSGFTSWWYEKNSNSIEEFVDRYAVDLDRGKVVSNRAGVTWKVSPSFLLPPAGQQAITIGDTVFLNDASDINDDGLTAHEYIHVLQGEDRGILLWGGYLGETLSGGGTKGGNRIEALGYLWQAYIDAYGIGKLRDYGDNQPWCYFTPIRSGWDYCGNQDYK